jgi:hypothetical protein
VKNWNELALKRKVWNDLSEEAKTHQEEGGGGGECSNGMIWMVAI